MVVGDTETAPAIGWVAAAYWRAPVRTIPLIGRQPKGLAADDDAVAMRGRHVISLGP